MSKNKEDSKDDSNVIDKISKKYFSEVENSVPHMQHVLFDLQNEYYKTWKNAVNANISLQKEFLSTSGFNNAMPEAAKSLIENMSEEAVRYRAYCNKITIANIESAKKSAKTLNDSAELFVDLNRKIMHYWVSTFFPKRN
ncbi:MAG: hypothetical protein OEQ15_01935 [Nitrosopumilus sp.]|nr:hypothetical protein [Nitrosopumilus sp.]